MRRLTEDGEAWRNYLYANREGVYNDIEDFLIRMENIRSSRDEILRTMLGDAPDMELVSAYKDEIGFQIENIEELVREFAEYCTTNSNAAHDDPETMTNVILDDLRLEGTDSYFYEIAEEWQEWGKKAHRIWDKLDECYGDGLYYQHDDLCRLIMDEVYGSHNGENREDVGSESEPMRWIPISERLPDKNGLYLTTQISHGDVRVEMEAYEKRNGWHTFADGIVAWMPFPEPYRG